MLLDQVEKFQFELVSPEAVLFTGEASMVVIPATSGDLGVLYNHAPTVLTLNKGIIDIYQGEKKSQSIFVGGGFANVTETGCVVMADEAVPVEDIHPSEVQKRIKEIEDHLDRAEEEEERRALHRDLSITRAKIDIIKRLTSL